MSWKNWPSWVKGGIIGGGIFLILGILCSANYFLGGESFFVTTYVMIPWAFYCSISQFVIWRFVDIFLNFDSGFFIFITLIVNFLIGFLIGSLIVLGYFGKKMRRSYTKQGFLTGIIISIVILFLVVFDCIPYPDFFNCLIGALIRGCLAIILSIILFSLIGFIIDKLKFGKKKEREKCA